MIGRWMLLAGSILAAAAVAEGVSRLVNFAPGPRLFELNQDYGWFHVPGAEAERAGRLIRINSLGLRDEEHSYSNGQGAYRVLVLGDSFAEGFQVSFEDVFSEQLQANLNRRERGSQVEVINGGVSGFGTGNELLFYQHEGRRYQPDAVVLLFFYNDVYDNVQRPFYNLVEGDLLRIEDPNRAILASFPELRSGLWDHSYAYRNLSVLWKILRIIELRQIIPGNGDSIEGIYRNPPPEELEMGWRLTEALLRELIAVTQEDGSAFAVVEIPAAGSLDEPEVGPGYDFARVTKRLGGIINGSGVCWVPLREAFKAGLEQGEDLYIPGDGHLNQAGHALAADKVQTALQGCGILP